ncbi:MAG: DNA ligase-associated DEXH box helicase, partial [Pseudomonadota bacterium]
VISDHADWAGLNEAIAETGAENVYTTHGYTDIFARWLNEKGYNAQVVSTEFTGESLDQPSGEDEGRDAEEPKDTEDGMSAREKT